MSKISHCRLRTIEWCSTSRGPATTRRPSRPFLRQQGSDAIAGAGEAEEILGTLRQQTLDQTANDHLNGTSDPYARGVTIDLPTRQMFGVGPCPGRGRPFFRIGPYFDFCTIEKYDAFLDLWIRKGVALSQAKPPVRRYEADKDCDRIDYEDIAPGTSFTVYLTPAGLAVHAGSLVRFKGDECGVERNSFNPVILPYRELGPFMKPGPWKDELLK